MSVPDTTIMSRGEKMPVEEENKALVRRFWEAQDECDLETIDELLAPDFVDHDPLPGQEPDREGFMKGVAEDCEALTHVRTTIDYQTTDGDIVISRGTPRAGHDRGAYLGVKAPAGQEREHKAIVVHRIAGGKIAEEWSAGSPVPLLESLVQEIRERELVEQDLRGYPNHPASLPAQRGARTARLEDQSLLPASQGGGKGLLRLLRAR
jgi:ketosteroid isomerase-like protein